MPYTKLTEAQLEILEPTLAALDRTLVGRGITVEDTAEGITIIKMQLYSHWYHEGTKKYYKMTQESPTALRIIKRALPKPRIAADEAPPNAVEDFVLDHLEDDFEYVTQRLNETFSPEEVLEGVKLWRRQNNLE